MRRLATFVAAGLIVSAGLAFVHAQAPAPAQGPPPPPVAKARATTPEIPYDSISFIKSMPAGLYMGEGIGVATNSKGGVYVFTRSGESRVFEFDRNGVFVKEFGKDSYGYGFAHAVRVDKDENVWSVDEGTNVILKYTPAGKLLMVLGKRPDALEQYNMIPGVAPFSGANRPHSFHRPTDIAWDPQGNIFVSDGYTDSRVVKYDKNGRFIKSAGTRGSSDLQFSTPHTIGVGLNGDVYVGDRGNRRIVVLDNNLNQKAIWDTVGAPWGLCTTVNGTPQYLYTSNSIGTTIDEHNRHTSGEIYKVQLPDGKVVGRFGKAGKALKEFASIHQMDCRNPNEIYVAEIQAWRIQRVTLHPERMTTTSAARN